MGLHFDSHLTALTALMEGPGGARLLTALTEGPVRGRCIDRV